MSKTLNRTLNQKDFRRVFYSKLDDWKTSEKYLATTFLGTFQASSSRIPILFKTESLSPFLLHKYRIWIALVCPYENAQMNKIRSLSGHALYDVWHHRIRKLPLFSIQTKTTSTTFSKKLHSYLKPAFLVWRVDWRLKRKDKPFRSLELRKRSFLW